MAVVVDGLFDTYESDAFDMAHVEFKGTKVQKAAFEEIVNRNSSFPVIKSWFVENFTAGITVEKAKSEIATANWNWL